MTLNIGFSNRGFKTLNTGCLLACLLLFFLSDSGYSQEVNNQTPPPSMTVEQANAQDALTFLISHQILPADLTQPDQPVSRGHLAATLINALGFKSGEISEFPFYRDVTREHSAYIPIEIAREKRFLTFPEDHGFYYPEKAVLFSEVYQALAKTMTGPNPDSARSTHLVSGFADSAAIPEDLKPALAKLVETQFLPGDPQKQAAITLKPDEVVRAKELAPLILKLMVNTSGNPAVLFPEPLVLPTLPAGLALTITPTSAIFKSRVTVGDSLYFSLVNAVNPLPQNSRLRGNITQIQDPDTFLVKLDRVDTPDGLHYQTNIDLTLHFTGRRDLLVPGNDLPVVTQPTEIMTPVSSEPPPNPPVGSSGSTSVPSSAPR